jgi:hypothetical protein
VALGERGGDTSVVSGVIPCNTSDTKRYHNEYHAIPVEMANMVFSGTISLQSAWYLHVFSGIYGIVRLTSEYQPIPQHW